MKLWQRLCEKLFFLELSVLWTLCIRAQYIMCLAFACNVECYCRELFTTSDDQFSAMSCKHRNYQTYIVNRCSLLQSTESHFFYVMAICL